MQQRSRRRQHTDRKIISAAADEYSIKINNGLLFHYRRGLSRKFSRLQWANYRGRWHDEIWKWAVGAEECSSVNRELVINYFTMENVQMVQKWCNKAIVESAIKLPPCRHSRWEFIGSNFLLARVWLWRNSFMCWLINFDAINRRTGDR